MYLDSVLDEILSYLQFIFITATLVLVLYEFKEVLKYEEKKDKKEH